MASCISVAGVKQGFATHYASTPTGINLNYLAP